MKPSLASCVLAAACVAVSTGCGEVKPAATVASTITTGVSYPSSAAYDREAHVLLVGSYTNGSVQRVPVSGRMDDVSHEALPQDGRTDVLRIRIDAKRHRIWVLATNGLDLYDAQSSRLIRRIPIDALGQHSEEHCLPDMTLDSHGSVFISSAMQVRLMRVDAERLEVTHHELQLDSDQGKDFGFSAIAFAGENDRLYAASATSGTLWEIDFTHDRARKLALSHPVWGACALHAGPAKAREGDVLYVARGFRDGIARIELSGSDVPYRVTTIPTQRPLIAPTDFVLVEHDLLAVISQLSHHRDFKGYGEPLLPFRMVSVVKP